MAELRAPILLAVGEVRDLVERVRSEVVRHGDDVQVIRERLDGIEGAVIRLAELEERRQQSELATSTEVLERSRWYRTVVSERVLIPLIAAVLSFVAARVIPVDHEPTPELPPLTDPTEVPDARDP